MFPQICLHHLHSKLNVKGKSSFWDLSVHEKILHMLSNTWVSRSYSPCTFSRIVLQVSIPVREANQKNQVHNIVPKMQSFKFSGDGQKMSPSNLATRCTRAGNSSGLSSSLLSTSQSQQSSPLP